jgi:hypothetical protein
MSEPGQESGTAEKPVEVDWAAALSETLSKSQDKPAIEAAKEPDPSDVHSTDQPDKKPVETEASEVRESPEDALEPPAKWSDEFKLRFRSLGKDEQKFLLDREKDVESHLTKRTQELSETQKRYQKLDDVLKPYEEVARRSGVDLTPHVAQAIQAYMSFQRDPASTLRSLIQASKLTPEQLGLVDDGTDPNIRALRDQLDETRRELAGLKQGTVQATESQYASQIAAFKDAKDEAGAPKHPHFDSVRSLMAPLVDSGKSLEEAYAEVVWALPEYRESQLKATKEQSEKEAKKKAETARLDKLKKAKSAETLAPSDAERGNGATKFKGWEASLQESFNKLRS